MARFIHAHATHPDAFMALALAAAQIDAQLATPLWAEGPRPTLGWVYFSELFSGQAQPLLEELRQRWPGLAWVGCSAVGLCATGVEYFDEPALVLQVCDLPRDQWRVFSGVRPLGHWPAATLQLHADGGTPELQELITELAGRSQDHYLFGGLVSGREQTLQLADGVFSGGFSGLALGPQVALVSRVSQGCQPLGPERRISACEGGLLLELDGRPALDCLLEDLGLPAASNQAALRGLLPRLRNTLAGLRHEREARRPGYGAEIRVRHLLGVDPARRAVAVAERLESGDALSFCVRDAEAARRDLLRICTEIRAEAEDREQRMAGALYFSCAGRGGPHFGAPSAELQWVRHALGDLPLAGFFAAGEIAHDKLYGYTGVLTVFLSPAEGAR